MAAGLSVDLDRWRSEFDELMLHIGGRFARVEPRRRVAAFVAGLLAGLPRVNCWSIAEHAGEDCPRGMQRLLSEAVWDEAGVRDDLRGYVLEHFADPGAVLVADETGDLKKGTATAGVQRQYTGTAGRTENAQVAVYLAYAAPAGCAFIDRAFYLPKSWAGDPARCRAAGVPAETAFATKPALARASGHLDPAQAMRVRVIEYEIPDRGGSGELIALITTITGPALASAGELARAYCERWEEETGNDQLKTCLRGPGSVLRSKSPGMVRQEIYGCLLTHYAISALICKAATEADIDPDRVKFLRTVRIIRRRAADPAFPP